MLSSFRERAGSRPWYGRVIYVVAFIQVLLVGLSVVVSLTSSEPFDQPQFSALLVMLPLLGYLALGYFAQKNEHSTNQPLRIGTMFGIGQGIILGLLLMLPLPFTASTVVMEALIVPGMASGHMMSHGQRPQSLLLLVIHAVLSLLSYGVCAFWVTRRTNSVVQGYISALLAAFISALITSGVVALVYHAPLVVGAQPPDNSLYQAFPPDGSFPFPLNYLASYCTCVASAITALLSQFIFAFIGGLLGIIWKRPPQTLPDLSDK